jgi:hypothetical protein
MKFQKIFLLPVENLEQLREKIIEEKNLNNLDLELYKILRNKKLNENEKYFLYKKNLIEHAKLMRRNNFSILENSPQKPEIMQKPIVKHVECAGSQTKMIFKDSKSSNTEEKVTGEAVTQTVPEKIIPSLEDVFETSNVFDSLREEETDDYSGAYNLTGTENEFSGNSSATTIKRKIASKPDISIYEMKDGSVVTKFKDETTKKNNKIPKKHSKKSTSTPQKSLTQWETLYKY